MAPDTHGAPSGDNGLRTGLRGRSRPAQDVISDDLGLRRDWLGRYP
ncbi:hypothetical protein [Gemmobacter megaterium]|nr:hypothetical protein [Gemmobacter megaterium]